MIIMRKKIILTIPHAKCDPNDSYNKHLCDYSAEENAKKLANTLKQQGFNPIVLKGNINRKKMDLNREKASQTLFHQNLDHLLDLESPTMVLDIHSGDFPSEDHLVLLDLKNEKDDQLITDLANTFSSKIYQGSDANYIVKKSHDKGIKAMLIEFNEQLEYPPEFFTEITHIIKKNSKKS